MPMILDPQAQAVAQRLHKQGRRQMGALIGHYLPMLPRMLLGKPVGAPANPAFFHDKLLPIEAGQGELLYLMALAARPKCVVEYGTSFGVSTIYLAAALRDAGCGGRVIGTELVPEKVLAARANLEAAGLAAQVEIREGDARETLRDFDRPIDMLLLDGWPILAGEILALVEPRLAEGALILADNVGQFPADTRDAVDRVGDAGRYRSTLLPLRGGTLLAVRHGAAP
jgi:predicted O-methyltransferase YrrM